MADKAPRKPAKRTQRKRAGKTPKKVAEKNIGRPKVLGCGRQDPIITFRIPVELREALGARAQEVGVSMSEVCRMALLDSLSRPPVIDAIGMQALRDAATTVDGGGT